MTGEQLYRKAQNGGKGFPPFEKLSPGQKGLWGNAARELQHEVDVAVAVAREFEAGFVIGHLSRCKCINIRDERTGQVVRDIGNGEHRK